jgi:dihydropteroate synthase
VKPQDFPFPWGSRTWIMGILNITPDSFSGDGLLKESDWIPAVLEKAKHFVASGADILDIGGESTRPGAQTVDEAEELRRIVPVVNALAKAELGVILSVDTYKASVAQASLQAGAHWINDIWSLRADPAMATLVARQRCPIILMHNRMAPENPALLAKLHGWPMGTQYKDVVSNVINELLEYVRLAEAAGVQRQNIILDPGIGFGKTVEQNLELVNRLEEIRALGFPILLGPSRKSFIGKVLDLPAEDRLEGTAAAAAIGISRGADILRVHDVAAITRVARLTDALVRKK